MFNICNEYDAWYTSYYTYAFIVFFTISITVNADGNTEAITSLMRKKSVSHECIKLQQYVMYVI